MDSFRQGAQRPRAVVRVVLSRRGADEAIDVSTRPEFCSYLVIVNPAAGTGEGRARAEELAENLPEGHEVRIVETKERGSAIDLAERLAGDVDRIIAIGGDGTLNEVLTGLMRARDTGPEIAALGFLPSGTANAAARAFELTDAPARVGQGLPHAEIHEVDVGIVHHGGGIRPFLVRIGAGLDAVIFEELNASRTGVMGFMGLVRKVPRVYGALMRYPGPPIDITVDGEFFARAVSVIVPNVGKVGFLATMSESADPCDGMIEVLALSIRSNWSMVRLTLQTVTSSLERSRDVHLTRGREVKLESASETPFHVDGEPVGNLPVRIHLEPQALRLLVI